MALMLHCGANPIDYPSLREVITPEPTPSHVPIPHHRLVDMVRHTLASYGHEVISESHRVAAGFCRVGGRCGRRRQGL